MLTPLSCPLKVSETCRSKRKEQPPTYEASGPARQAAGVALVSLCRGVEDTIMLYSNLPCLQSCNSQGLNKPKGPECRGRSPDAGVGCFLQMRPQRHPPCLQEQNHKTPECLQGPLASTQSLPTPAACSGSCSQATGLHAHTACSRPPRSIN